MEICGLYIKLVCIPTEMYFTSESLFKKNSYDTLADIPVVVTFRIVLVTFGLTLNGFLIVELKTVPDIWKILLVTIGIHTSVL